MLIYTHLSTLVKEILNKTNILYLGYLNKTNYNIVCFPIESGDETETHHNYLMGLPQQWRQESDINLMRWRYRKDLNVVYWWEFNRPNDDEKEAVDLWIKKNLFKSTPSHRIILTDRSSINFIQSHEL
jgi:hypothetical protein